MWPGPYSLEGPLCLPPVPTPPPMPPRPAPTGAGKHCTWDSPLSAPWAPEDPRPTHTFPGPYKQGKGLSRSVGNR